MATNKAKIGYDVIRAAKKDNEKESVVIKWNKIPITIKRTLSLDEAAAFVMSVVNACFDGTDGYAAENEHPAVRSAVLALYTNIELPTDQFQQYDLIYTEDLYEMVLGKINLQQLNELVDAAERDIDYKINADINELRKKTEEFERNVEELTKEISEVFSGMSSDDVAETIKMLSSTKLDEEKLMNAYIKNVENRGNGNASE